MDDATSGIWSLDIDAGGHRSQIVANQLVDILLLTSDRAAMARLLPLLAVAASSASPVQPSPVAPSASSAPVTAPSLPPASPTG